MTSQTPVEIWHKILRYAISVPLFFDVNPAETYGVDSISNYYYELAYWDSERTRYSLRAVCKGWDAFLRRYNHRYVRLADVFHERIPVSVLPLAIRLYIEPDSMCECKQYCKIRQRLSGEPFWITLKNRMMAVLERATALVDENQRPLVWNLEILNGQLTRSGKDFELLKQRAPRLASLIGKAGHDLSTVNSLSDTLYTFTTDGDWGIDEPVPSDILSLSNLTTLYLCLISMNLPVQEWSLPSLRHLSIYYYGAVLNRNVEQRLIGMLKVLGGNLETMYFHSDIEAIPVSQELWKVCPNLLRVQMPYTWIEEPPKGHPIRTFRISAQSLAYYIDYAFVQAIPFLPKLPTPSDTSNRPPFFEVRLDQTWSRVLLRSESYIGSIAFFIFEHYVPYGVQLRDSEGVSFQNFVLYMLMHHWKRSSHRELRKFPTRYPLFF
ncbi:hypothetical protein CPB86DRAFT_782487 [Serendipita vermifera]|nr:hypothetical protein CPB86DRAFT_782487 [Serendipita vermifera]